MDRSLKNKEVLQDPEREKNNLSEDRDDEFERRLEIMSRKGELRVKGYW